MKYKNTNRKIREIWVGADKNFRNIDSHYVKTQKIKEALKINSSHLFKKMNRYETDWEAFEAYEPSKRLWKTWEVSIKYIPKRFIPYIQFCVLIDSHHQQNSARLSDGVYLNKIVRIEEENVADIEGLMQVTFLLSAVTYWGVTDLVPQVDAKLLMFIINPEIYV
ncbi:MAG: hypothetical protein JW924_03240 [Fusobacteriaceae bacterium]|nr:hypothetical protein [Fusobacteriaceae bacterium]